MAVTSGIQAEAKAAEAIEHMDAEVIESFAALDGAPDGVAELAISAFPRGTRLWVIAYGLAAEDGERVQLTDAGRAAIGMAAERCPNPYADVAVDDLAPETRAALDELARRTSITVEEPETSGMARHGETRAFRAGQLVGVLLTAGAAHLGAGKRRRKKVSARGGDAARALDHERRARPTG